MSQAHDGREIIPPDSPEEAAITESLLTGNIAACMRFFQQVQQSTGVQIKGINLIPHGPQKIHSNVHFEKLVIEMASGEYEVTVKKRG